MFLTYVLVFVLCELTSELDGKRAGSLDTL